MSTSVQVFAGPAHLHGLSVNLSDGGMCFFTIANLPVGAQVEVEFVPPKSEGPVRIGATVRHRALYLYGIEFLADDLQRRDALTIGQQPSPSV